MALVIDGGLNIPMPRMLPIRQKFSGSEITNIAEEIKRLFSRDTRLKRIKKGDRIAVSAGSRGINSIDKIVQALVQELKLLGANPFIVPAMGSHGGATAEGQRKVLASYGITEEAMGAPIKSSMEVKQIGQAGEWYPGFPRPGSVGQRWDCGRQPGETPHGVQGGL